MLVVASLLSSTSFTQAQEVLVAHEFHVTEAGGFGIKTIHEMGSPEFQVLATAACAAYGVNCAGVAGKVRTAAQIAAPIFGQLGSNVYITGNVTRHEGIEWNGIFSAPVGYEICDALLDYGRMSITGGSTFNATVTRVSPDNGLGFYAAIPQNGAGGREWVEAYFVVKYVPAGTTSQYNCLPSPTSVWQCKGQACTPLHRF
jgi:hypothetical protein